MRKFLVPSLLPYILLHLHTPGPLLKRNYSLNRKNMLIDASKWIPRCAASRSDFLLIKTALPVFIRSVSSLLIALEWEIIMP